MPVSRRRASALRPHAIRGWPEPFDPATELDWGDPEVSRRVLLEHLDQAHDGASRRIAEIERHLQRLERLLPAPPLRILDAACGPGLYAVRLAARGHDVLGTDIGPAVLGQARRTARAAGVADSARFAHWDLRDPAPAGMPVATFDAVLLLYWVLEAFPRGDHLAVVRRLAEVLRPGGRMVMELRVRPDQPPGRLSHWDRVPRSLLADEPHLLLTDTTWDDRRRLYVLREVALLDDGTLAAQQTTGALTTLEGARGLVGRAGLRLRGMYDGWSRFRATGLSDSLVVVAQRPPTAPAEHDSPAR